jgi:CxxC motif-containing protein (DUF1111 family)
MLQIQFTDTLMITLEAVTAVREEVFAGELQTESNGLPKRNEDGDLLREELPMLRIFLAGGGQIELRNWTLKAYQEATGKAQRYAQMSGSQGMPSITKPN